jgi:FKBP-type peptidyl-prolyl cis-trans isomerase FkpA/FKBP-type peptidyl-prolyl cis-trans isomerase FklB
MKPNPRTRAALLAIATLAFAAACNKPADKPAAAKTEPSEAAGKDESALKIPGLPTEKEQASYMIGMRMAKQLEPVKDDVNVDTIARAIKSSLAGEKMLMTEEQASQVEIAFGEKMRAKQIAEMMAKGRKNAEAGPKFLAENAKKPGVQTTASGLQYQAITEGKGPKPKESDVVRVHYKGTDLDGKVFDSSYDRGEPAMIPLSQVVPGWREGILLMPVGSKYKLWIPSKLGYGENPPPGAPFGPNATLAFEVELLEIVKAPEQPAN